MPIRTDYVILCDSATITSGKFNLIGIFDRLGAIAIPAIHPSFAVVAKIIGGMDTDEHTLRVRFLDPNGQDIIPPAPERRFRFGELGAHQMLLTLEHFPIVREGFWSIVVEVDGREVGRADLTVQTGRNAGGEGGRHMHND